MLTVDRTTGNFDTLECQRIDKLKDFFLFIPTFYHAGRHVVYLFDEFVFCLYPR